MVCAKCQKLNKTTLATPGVKKKSEMYYGSAASSSSSTGKKSATLGQTGISKVCIHALKISWRVFELTGFLEQAAFQGGKEPLRPIFELVHKMQGQGFPGAYLLQPVCLSIGLCVSDSVFKLSSCSS